MTTHSNLNPSAPVFDPPLISPVLCTGLNPVVFLQTAVANISKPQDHTCVQKIRLMMDCGSQRSYLVKQAAENLSLPVTGRQQLSIVTFGSTRGSGVT